MIKNKNFSNQQTPSIIDTEYHNCNFSQSAPIDKDGKKIGVPIFPGDSTPITFIECNMVNCQPPENATLIRCNTTLRESQIESGTEAITINDRETTIKRYVDKIYGRTNPDSLKPEYRTTLEIKTRPPEGSRDYDIKMAVKEIERAKAIIEEKEAEATDLTR